MTLADSIAKGGSRKKKGNNNDSDGFDIWAGGSLTYTGHHLSGPGHVTEAQELGPYAEATLSNAWKRAKHR